MNYQIKNDENILSKIPNNEGGLDFLLKPDSKLGKIF